MAITYSAPKLEPRTRQALERGEFDFLQPYRKQLLRTDEVGTLIGRDPRYVRDLVESGRLEAHRDSATGERKSNIITSRSVLLYLVETANYVPADFEARLLAWMKTLTPAALHRLITVATRQREQI